MSGEITTFDADLLAIRETREQMRELRERLEEELELDPALGLAGPTIERVIAAEEKADETPPRTGPKDRREWGATFDENWPSDWTRHNPRTSRKR